jgi:hypothetical protein
MLKAVLTPEQMEKYQEAAGAMAPVEANRPQTR